jgi:putative FmdB family regulatory protein
MPTYLYRCLTCEKQAEVVQAFTDATLTTRVCESCGTEQPVKKVFTPVGVSFKGSGFYKTDSRSGSSATSPASSGSSGSSESKSETKSESTAPAKTETKSETKSDSSSSSSSTTGAAAAAS